MADAAQMAGRSLRAPTSSIARAPPLAAQAFYMLFKASVYFHDAPPLRFSNEAGGGAIGTGLVSQIPFFLLRPGGRSVS